MSLREATPLKDIVYGDEQTLDRVKAVLRKEFSLQALEGNTLREIVESIKRLQAAPTNGRSSILVEPSPATAAAAEVSRRNGSPAGSAQAAQLLSTIDPANLEAPAAFDILKVCLALAAFLMQKNRAYGNSAIEPIRAMSKADPAEQIRVRMDDKLSRMIRGEAAGEDAVKDFVGYWVLLEVLKGRS
jgi:hypothetical protein